MAKVDEILIRLEPTALTLWLLRHWYVGVMVAPFFGILPTRWFVKASGPKEYLTKDSR